MTDKQAINILSSLPLQAPNDSELADIQTAIRMAINALEEIQLYNQDRPAVLIDGKLLYITQGHIDAMARYDREQILKEYLEKEEKNEQ